MTKETMTPRERWLAVLRRQKPDRVPLDYRATPELTQKLMRHLGCRDRTELLQHLHVDAAIYARPRYVGPPVSQNADVFGCQFRNVNYGTGAYPECVYHPLAKLQTLAEIERSYTWPDPDWWDYSEIPRQVTEWERYPVWGGGSEPFLIYKNLRGEEQAYVDMILHPEMVHHCLDKLYGLCYENTRRIYEQIPGKVMITPVAEDLGSQEGLMYSLEQIGEFFLPWMKRMIELAHQEGAYVFYHSDGAIRKVLPCMIEVGMDILDPVQWRCKGMDRRALKRDFGDKLIFHGAVDNQYTLAFGSTEEVRREVIDNFQILGQAGGYILGPCHNIQPVSPIENVLVMYETAYHQSWL